MPLSRPPMGVLPIDGLLVEERSPYVTCMRSFKKTLGVMAVVADIALMMTGCVTGVVDLDDDFNHSGNVEVSASFSRTLVLDDQVSIRITGANGSVQLMGVPDAQEVVVEAVRRVRSDSRNDAEAHLPDVQVLVEVRSHEFEIKTVQPNSSHGRTYVVDYDITVPSHLLPSIANGNGSIHLEGIQADIDVTNGNGEVVLMDVEGSSWVSVGNGGISTWAFLPSGGQIVHSLGNGTLFLSIQPQVSASFGARVGNGTINVTGLNLSQVVSSPRQLQGLLGTGEGYIDLSAGNGQIRVQGG